MENFLNPQIIRCVRHGLTEAERGDGEPTTDHLQHERFRAYRRLRPSENGILAGIIEPLTIDGTSRKPELVPNCTDEDAPLIELNGSALSTSANEPERLWITAGNGVVRGLTISRFPDNMDSDRLDSGNTCRMQLHRHRLKPEQLDFQQQYARAITLSILRNNTIGGAATLLRSMISSNTSIGIALDDATTADRRIPKQLHRHECRKNEISQQTPQAYRHRRQYAVS